MAETDPPNESHETHVEWLEKILQEGINLTTWEEEFVEDLGVRFQYGNHLTSRKQEVILEHIYAQRTP